MSEKLTEQEILDALRDVAENNGHMEAPGTDAQIRARWKALRSAGLIHRANGRFAPSDTGRAMLAAAGGKTG